MKNEMKITKNEIRILTNDGFGNLEVKVYSGEKTELAIKQ